MAEKNPKEIFDRIGVLYKKRNDTEVAEFLGITRDRLYAAKKRGTIPYKEIIANCPPEDLSYVLTGFSSQYSEDMTFQLEESAKKDPENYDEIRKVVTEELWALHQEMSQKIKSTGRLLIARLRNEGKPK